MDADSCEVAKIELAKQFGSISQLIPDQHKQKFIKVVKESFLQLGVKTSVRTRETTLAVLSQILAQFSEQERIPYADVYA